MMQFYLSELMILAHFSRSGVYTVQTPARRRSKKGEHD
jgi:hypothetical protein